MAWYDKLLNILNTYNLSSKDDLFNMVFSALCEYGLASDTDIAERTIKLYLTDKSVTLADLPLNWKQAVYAYLWHRIGRCAADDWEKYCLNEEKVLFTDDKIDQLRKEYICRADSELNICRILLNLDLAKHGSLPTQLQHINSNEREIIKSDLPLLAKLAGFLR